MTTALIANNLPIPSALGSLDAYISAVNRVPVLTVEDEQALARRFREEEDLEAAKAPGARVFFESRVNNEEGSHPRYRDINVAFKSEMSRYLMGEVALDQAFDAFYQERARILSGG